MTCDDIDGIPLPGGRNINVCMICGVQDFTIDIMLGAIPSEAQDHCSVCAVLAIGWRHLTMTVSKVFKIVHLEHKASQQRRRTSGFSAGWNLVRG